MLLCVWLSVAVCLSSRCCVCVDFLLLFVLLVSILTASCTHPRRIDKFKELLKLPRNKMHKELGFVNTKNKKNYDSDQQYLQAHRHMNHTLNTDDAQSCLYKVS